ncbi:unnamed protein product, partial [Prunus brigantina]
MLKDLKAKNFLFQAIDRVTLETILKKDTTKDIWDSLKQKYQATTRVERAQLQALHREFEILTMKEGESITNYFETIANKMRINGEQMEDVIIVEKILRSMTSKFAYVVCSIEESKDVTELSIDELQSSLLVHEQRMISQVVEEKLLKVSLGTWDKSNVECYRCHRYGHYQYECPESAQKEEQSNYVESEEVLLMAYIEEKNPKPGIWYLDSGCSNLMSGNKSLFSDLNEDFREHVKLGDNSSISVMGKGNIQVHIDENTVHKIANVFYVPTLKNNLISMGQLEENGHTIIIQAGCCQVRHPARGLVTEVK